MRVVQRLPGSGAAGAGLPLLPGGLRLLLHLRGPHLGVLDFAGGGLLGRPAAGLHVGHGLAGGPGGFVAQVFLQPKVGSLGGVHQSAATFAGKSHQFPLLKGKSSDP